MPKASSLTAEVEKVLRLYPEGATMPEIRAGVQSVRPDVRGDSVRSAVYRNLDDKGNRLFRRAYMHGQKPPARYFLKA